MAPFFKRANAAASLQADIASLLKRRAVLEKQHDEAQNSAAAKMRAARDLLLADGADPVAIETAENAIRDAEIAVRTRADALVEIGRQIAEVEGKAAKLAEDRQRKQTADEIGAMSAEIGPAGTAAIDALNTLAEVAGRAGTVTADATGVKLACERFAADLPAALELVESLLTSHAQAVLTGHAPATLRQPEAAPTPKVAPPAPTVRVFTTKPIKWRDPSNPVFVLNRPAFSQCDLEPRLAEAALTLKAAIPITDPQVAVLARHYAKDQYAPLSQCVSLDGHDDDDAANEQQPIYQDEIVRHSAFARP